MASNRAPSRARVRRARADDPGLLPAQGPPRRIVVAAFPDVQVLDVTGPLEVFGRTARWLVERGYRSDLAYKVEIAGPRRGPLVTSSGFSLVADLAYRDLRPGIDTLLVAGGRGAQAASRDRTLLACLRRMAPRVRRLGSVCTGTYVLAAAGVLDGRRATTHWAYCEDLAKRYPDVAIDAEPIFVRDGHIYTSAGVTTGMDLALAMVEEDHGHQIALEVARQLVLFLRRPGGQAQFSAQLSVQAADREPLRELQRWMADHLDDDLSVSALAARVAMSPRHFARVFAVEVGTTPARFVERLRVEAGRRRLEESTDGVDAIAAACGFGTAEGMRRAFRRVVHVSPTAYRAGSRDQSVH
jgi:transcriptional regulator GlxA family with amidase domain